jgi:hypothetical protein
VLENAHVRAIAVPAGGARVVAFGPRSTDPQGELAPLNAFDATGGLRDDVLLQPPPSATDRIAKYTHSYPAGMFNRRYAPCLMLRAPAGGEPGAAGAYLRYGAPDVVPDGAAFERVLALGAADRLVADLRLTPRGAATAQRLVSYSAIAERGDTVDDGTAPRPSDRPATLDPGAGGVAFTATATAGGDGGVARHPVVKVVSVAWRPEDVEAATWTPARSNGTLRLVLAPDSWRRLTFASATVRDTAEAAAFVQAERRWVAANPAPAKDGEVAKRYTQSPQKRPSENSCGFESHLPQ